MVGLRFGSSARTLGSDTSTRASHAWRQPRRMLGLGLLGTLGTLGTLGVAWLLVGPAPRASADAPVSEPAAAAPAAAAPAAATPATPATPTTPAPTAEELADARRIFAVGIQHADHGEWEDAVVCFRQVLEVREAPPVLFNLGAALVSLGQYPEAEPLLRRVVDDPTAEASLVERAQASLTTMETRGGRVTLRLVDAPASAVVYIDGKVLETAQIGVEVPMTAGEHELIVRAGSETLARRAVRVTVGQHAEVVLTFDADASALAEQDSQSVAAREALAATTELGDDPADRAARRRQRLRSPWLWSGVGAGVVLIVAVVIVATHEPGVDAPVQGNSNPALVRF